MSSALHTRQSSVSADLSLEERPQIHILPTSVFSVPARLEMQLTQVSELLTDP